MFKVKQINGKDIYYSDLIETEHFFTSRNLIVKDNIEEICEYLNIATKELIHPTQIHSDKIEIVKENKYIYDSTDALILNIKNKAVYLNFADCVPVILYDYKNNISAIAHAGWRGTAERIAQKTAIRMIKIFNSNPKYIVAAIGPCISFEEFETYPDAIKKLKASITKINTP